MGSLLVPIRGSTASRRLARYAKALVDRARIRHLGTLPAPDYHEAAINEAARFSQLKGKRVLIVGVNTGEDCERFIRRGAGEIHGLDVIEEVGRNFTHPAVTYHREKYRKDRTTNRLF